MLEKILIFVVEALCFVTLPLYLFYRIYKRARSKKSFGGAVFELLIVVSILFILAAIVVPDFLKFQAKAKCSEVKTYLGQIFTLQAKYHEKYGAYAGGPDTFMYLGWKPEGGSNFAYFCGEDYIPNYRESAPNRPRFGREHRPAITGTSATGFTCSAVGNIDNDPALDYWSVNDRKEFKNEPSDL